MKLMFRGGAGEVGRSCIELHTHNSYFMMDCGIKLGEHGTQLPLLPTNTHEIDGVFLSHAHLDHTGALPVLEHRGYGGPLFATKATRQISRVLLEDAFKIGRITHAHMEYDEEDILKALNFMRRVGVNSEGQIKDVHYGFFEAGHIPGSASIALAASGKKIVYTGDIKCEESRLMKPADTDYYFKNDDSPVDALIIESTYGDREHSKREVEERQFINKLVSTVEAGGSVIVPVFALGRAQEIILLISEHMKRINCPVYLDGMSVKLTKIMLDNPQSVKDHGALSKAFSAVKAIGSGRDRRRAAASQGVFITTSGMLTGGPVLHYLKRLHHSEKSSILMTGYQGSHTNGDLLLKTGQVYIDGWKTSVKCQVEKFDFSAHAGFTDLKRIIKDANPETVIVQHGEPASANNLAQWAKEHDFRVEVPSQGDIVKL